MKIDVEGTEPAVLAGLAGRLRALPPDAVLVEVNTRMLGLHGFRAEDVLDPLIRVGYRLYRLGVLRRLRPLRRLRVDARNLETPSEGRTQDLVSLVRQGLRESRTFFNVLAIRPEAR